MVMHGLMVRNVLHCHVVIAAMNEMAILGCMMHVVHVLYSSTCYVGYASHACAGRCFANNNNYNSFEEYCINYKHYHHNHLSLYTMTNI